VHCTHGYNRTGFMITHCLMRLAPQLTVAQCIAGCAGVRGWRGGRVD